MSRRDWIHHNLTTGRTIVRRAASRSTREPVAWAVVDGAVPHVSAASRERNVRNGARDVHARIEGAVSATGEGAPDVSGLRCITYNPFRSAVFHYADTGEEWKGAGRVIVYDGYAWEVSR